MKPCRFKWFLANSNQRAKGWQRLHLEQMTKGTLEAQRAQCPLVEVLIRPLKIIVIALHT